MRPLTREAIADVARVAGNRRVAIAMAVVVVVFGTVGYSSLRGIGLAEAVYRSLGLFTLATGSIEGHVPVLLQVARFLAPVVSVLLLAELTVWAAEKIRSGELGLPDRAVLVCGYGRTGQALVSKLERLGREITVVTRGEHERLEGVVIGDATHADVLRRARAHTASAVFVACGDDATNAEIAITVLGINPSCPVVVAIEDHRLADLLPNANDDRLTPFAPLGDAADEVIRAVNCDWPKDRALSVLMLGMGRFGQLLTERLIDLAFRERRELLVCGADRGAARKMGAVIARKGIDDMPGVTASGIDLEFESAQFEQVSYWPGSWPSPDVIVLTMSEDAASLALAGQLVDVERFPTFSSATIYLRITDDRGGMAELLTREKARRLDHDRDARRIVLVGARQTIRDVQRLMDPHRPPATTAWPGSRRDTLRGP